MAVEFTKINHFSVHAPMGEEAKVREFYEGILGLKEVAAPQELNAVYKLIWYRLCDIIFHVTMVPNFVRPQTEIVNGVFYEGQHMAIEVKNLPEVLKYCQEKKVDVRFGVKVPDRERFYIVDPFGNFFELIELHKK